MLEGDAVELLAFEAGDLNGGLQRAGFLCGCGERVGDDVDVAVGVF